MEDKPILIVDDDAAQRRLIDFWLKEEGYTTILASDGKVGLQEFETKSPRLVIADIRMPGLSGIELLGRIKGVNDDALVILITAFGTVENAVEAMKLGASDYILKPLNADELKIVVRRALQHQQLVEENRYLRDFAGKAYRFENIVGGSRKMREVFELAVQVAQSDSTVLVTGESGTGKELLAKAIHQNSQRSKKPFVTINCGAIPETLIESELFGHRKGSFTGAIADRIGKFEAGNEGTVFLDEVSELVLNAQVKLLRVLQEREIDKVGDPRPVKVNVRIIAATNRNLRNLVEDGQFREDLFYRLSVITIDLPPLRERREDIPLLVDHFLRKYCDRCKAPAISPSEEVLDILTKYNWPGNVREMENLMERLVVLRKGSIVLPEHLPGEIRQPKSRVANLALELPDEGIDLEEVEKEILLLALQKHLWNQTRAARFLNISRKTLIYRMEKFGIRDPNESAAAGASPVNKE
jgi:DNA-binding NtrC family response regulator